MKKRTFRNLAGMILLGVSIVALAPAPVAAESRKEKREEASKRSLEGLVTDTGDNAVVGAVVKLKDMKTLQVRSFIAKDKGEYYFHGLSTDVDYEVKAESNGHSSASKTLSTFDSHTEATLNLTLK